jgi:hypothetical protein
VTTELLTSGTSYEAWDQDRRNYVWDNRSDTAPLRNNHGRFIDETSWGRNRHGGRH